MQYPRKHHDSIRANTASIFLFIGFKILKPSFQKFSCKYVKISLIHLSLQTYNDNVKLCSSIRHSKSKDRSSLYFILTDFFKMPRIIYY